MNIQEITKRIIDETKKHPEHLIKGSIRSLRIQIEGKDIYINPNRLVRGNEKLKNIWIFDTPAGSPKNGGVCQNSITCEKDCYARNQQLQYKNTRMFRLVNIYLFLKDQDYLLMLIENQIKRSRVKYSTFRIHSSGDFYDQTEIEFWNKFIQDHEEIKFYAYTKVDKLMNFQNILFNHNFNLIPSMIEHEGIKYRNFGKEEYIKRIAKKVGGFLCPATMLETKKSISCNDGCIYCVTENKPLFLIHGKGKNTVKKIKEIEINALTKKIA